MFNRTTQAYDGCTCECHRNPDMKHFAPCCYPPVVKKCPDCNGSGAEEAYCIGETESGHPIFDYIECDTCEGSGKKC